MPETTKQQKRQVAHKLMISSILKGRYIKDETSPNYLILEDGKKVSRVNLIGVIIDQQNNHSSNYKNITVDDGSGNINLKVFDSNQLPHIDNLKVGEPVAVIGLVRDFGNERYIIPEIIKKIENKDWIELRLIELNRKEKKQASSLEVYEVEEEQLTEDKGIFSVIRRLDKGEGADFSEIIKNSKDPNAEKILNNLIKTGELFEIRPGKIKILE